MQCFIDNKQKGYESIECYTYYVTFSCGLDLGFSRWNFEKICVMGMGGQNDMGKTGFQSIGCWNHIVTLNFDLPDDFDLGFSR